MTWNRGGSASDLVEPDVVPAAVMMELAAVSAEVLLQPSSVHAGTLRRAPDALFCAWRSSLARLAREARNAARASRAIVNASPTVSASVINSGSIGEVTM